MSGDSNLSTLINLIGSEENFCCNVSIGSKLDANAEKDLLVIREFKKSNENIESLQAAHPNVVALEYLKPSSTATTSLLNESIPVIWTYAAGVFEILLQICNELDCHDNLPISIPDTKKLHIGIRKFIEYGLKPFLLGIATAVNIRLPFIRTSVNVLLRIVCHKFFPLMCNRNDQLLIYTDLLSGIFMIIASCDDDHNAEDTRLQFEEHLHCIQSKLSHANYFKILFLIQGGSSSNKKPIVDALQQQLVHKQLMNCLYRPGSFTALCEALMPSNLDLDQDEEIIKKRMHCSNVIAGIVARQKHRKQFYHQIIDEIHQHLLCYIRRGNSSKSQQPMMYFTDVGVQCLSKLCALPLKSIHNHILDLTLGFFENFTTPKELVAGAIICEHDEFLDAVHMVHLTFCASGPSDDDTLPSKLLIPFMPMFIRIHYLLRDSTNNVLKNQVLEIIVRCLSNRDGDDLNKIVEWVLYEKCDENVKHLNHRVNIERIGSGERDEHIKFSVSAVTTRAFDDQKMLLDGDGLDVNSFLVPSTSMVMVLKQCKHNLLIYNVFLHLLQMFSDNFGVCRNAENSFGSNNGNDTMLEFENNLENAIEQKFKRKYAVIHALNELILFKSFHGQFAENPHGIVSTLDKMLNQQINHIQSFEKSNQKKQVVAEEFEEILMTILSVVEEFMVRVQNDGLKSKLEKTLKELDITLKTSQKLDTVQRKLHSILNTSDTNAKGENDASFLTNKAILCETHSEPYTKVYGIMNMIKLIQTKDEETRLNAHTVLALAMKMLKETDSYIFLNCIKLLIALCEIMEETVLETLIAEYHLDIDSIATDSAQIDFKLKVGETILKVTEGLGEMCYKYKSILTNCFLRGAYHQNDDFRTSNMSNLGAIMRILSYQIHHFFQEVILLIQNTLLYDKYLPTRRAAALVLTDLLKGMQSLEQYAEYLLPIYRGLKTIAANDPDLHMQIHAKNGLGILRDKIKEALTVADENKMEKEILITDVANKKPVKYK